MCIIIICVSICVWCGQRGFFLFLCGCSAGADRYVRRRRRPVPTCNLRKKGFITNRIANRGNAKICFTPPAIVSPIICLSIMHIAHLHLYTLSHRDRITHICKLFIIIIAVRCGGLRYVVHCVNWIGWVCVCVVCLNMHIICVCVCVCLLNAGFSMQRKHVCSGPLSFVVIVRQMHFV